MIQHLMTTYLPINRNRQLLVAAVLLAVVVSILVYIVFFSDVSILIESHIGTEIARVPPPVRPGPLPPPIMR